MSAPALNPQNDYISGIQQNISAGKSLVSDGKVLVVDDKRLLFQKGKQAELLSYFLKNHNLTLRKLGVLIGVSKTTVRDYLLEKNNLLLSTFNKLCLADNYVKKFHDYVVQELPVNWGAKKGGLERVKLMHDVNSYYFNLRQVKKIKELKEANLQKSTMQSHPLIEQLKYEGVDIKSILAVCLLTDGSMQVKGRHFRISYSSTDLVLRDIVFSLLNELSSRVPAMDLTKKGNYLVRVSDELLGKQLILLSPNYKTSPGKNQTCKQYLEELQPTLKFLENANLRTRIWAMRFGFTADGCISVREKGQPSIELACYHPTLSLEWKNLLTKLDFKTNIAKTKNSWCILSGIRIQTKGGFKKFYSLGGFIDDVKISKKSKKYCGMAKNELLKKVVKNGKERI